MTKNWAIAIGINHHDHHPELALSYAVRDAELIRDFLVNHAGFPADQVICCQGEATERHQPTYPSCDNLVRLINRELHPNRIGQVDRLWLFFSGHGITDNGRDYLITSSTLKEDLKRFALPIDEVIAALRLHNQADIVLVLDRCREVVGSKSVGGEQGQETLKLAKQRGITTIFSCDYGEYSYELHSLQHSAFTYALVEGLKQHTIPALLEAFLQRRVRELHPGTTQTPKIHGDSAQKANYPLLPQCVTVQDIAQLKDNATHAYFGEDWDRAEQLWEVVNECATSFSDRKLAMNAIKQIVERRGRGGTASQADNIPPILIDAISTKQSDSKPIHTFDGYVLPSRLVPPSQIPSGLNQFQFELITVNDQGKAIQPQIRTAHYLREDLGNGVTLDMVYIPGGEFLMGTAAADRDAVIREYTRHGVSQADAETWVGWQMPQHRVVVPTFFMGKTAVTQNQWRQVAQLPKIDRDLDVDPAKFKGSNRPVERVSWEEAMEFCARLSRHTGNQYRLPSEAEWEYACRAGTTTAFHFGATITADLVNCNAEYPYGNAPKGNYREQTVDVASLPPNGFGLYEMHGNVWEWCADHWQDSYQGAPNDGTAWLDENDNQIRVVRGGSWPLNPWYCRSADRFRYYLDDRSGGLGFRLVCSVSRTP